MHFPFCTMPIATFGEWVGGDGDPGQEAGGRQGCFPCRPLRHLPPAIPPPAQVEVVRDTTCLPACTAAAALPPTGG